MSGIQWICLKCDREFAKQVYLTKHHRRKIPCDRIINCETCGKIFSQMSTLNQHMERKISCDAPRKTKSDYQCNCCNLYFGTQFVLDSHKKICGTIENINVENLVENLVERIVSQTKKGVYEMIKNGMKNSGITINNVQNIQNNIVIVNYGSEDLSKLDYDVIVKMLGQTPGKIIPGFAQYLHNNPALPENRNIYIDSETGTALVKSDGKWDDKEMDHIVLGYKRMLQGVFMQDPKVTMKAFQYAEELGEKDGIIVNKNLLSINTLPLHFRESTVEEIDGTVEALPKSTRKELTSKSNDDLID